MPSTIRLCFTQYLHLLNGRKVPIGRICRDIPIYVDVRRPWEPPVEQVDPSKPFIDAFVNRFDGATVGPVLRDLGRTVAVLRQLDAIENADVRTRLQELVAESARELAAAALPDGELTFEAGAIEDVRPVDGPVPVG